MSWQLQPVNDAASPQPGGNSVDDFIRQNVVMKHVWKCKC